MDRNNLIKLAKPFLVHAIKRAHITRRFEKRQLLKIANAICDGYLIDISDYEINFSLPEKARIIKINKPPYLKRFYDQNIIIEKALKYADQKLSDELRGY
jgi:hypothetical protein